MFRAIYNSASAFTTVKGGDNVNVKSDTFDIKRGVLQGDILSPLFFILALELIFRRHDNRTDKGVTLGQTIIHTLAFADDAAQVNDGDTEGLTMASRRVSAVSKGSKQDADMSINVEKTKAQHVRTQEPITRTSNEEAVSVCKFVCPHVGCGFKFHTRRGMLIHAGKCEWKNEFLIDRIVECRGPTNRRKYKVRWKDYPEEFDTWEPRSHLHHETITEFEKLNGFYDYDWPHRCDICDAPCKSIRGIQIHRSRAHKAVRQQSFKGTLADRAVQVSKWKAQQDDRPQVRCEQELLENVYKFKYLGALIAADSQQCFDINARVSMAMQRCGQLRHVFDSPFMGDRLKMRLYKVAVCSLMTYGCEAWTLSEKVMRKLNGANSQMLSRITDHRTNGKTRSSLMHNQLQHFKTHTGHETKVSRSNTPRGSKQPHLWCSSPTVPNGYPR